jgi:hypothetical protein
MILMAVCFDRISTFASLDVSKVVEEKLEEKLSENQRQISHSLQQMLTTFFISVRWTSGIQFPIIPKTQSCKDVPTTIVHNRQLLKTNYYFYHPMSSSLS